MEKKRKWSVPLSSHFATIRGCLGSGRKGPEGLCVASLLGVLRSQVWLLGDEEVAWLLDPPSPPQHHHHHRFRTHSLSLSLCSWSADGGSEDLAEPRSPSVEPHLSHACQGKTQLSVDEFMFLFMNLLSKITVRL